MSENASCSTSALSPEILRDCSPREPYDDAAAEWHGREKARLEERGRTPPFVDGQIAAIAHNESLTLVTANTEDFRYFDDLEIADWTR
jgi:tRNA(fMet)-specific endonuclease VapC